MTQDFILLNDEVIEVPTTETESQESNSTTSEIQEVPTVGNLEYENNVISHLDSIYIVCMFLIFAIGSVVGTLLGKQLWRGASV